MNCPNCKTIVLKERGVKGSDVEVDCCSVCKGIWFQEEELEAVAAEAIKELVVPRGAMKSSRMCPECFGAMHEFEYPQTMVKIDMCKKCSGLWVDGGEFKEIRVVRRRLQAAGTADEYDEVTGVKGGLLGLIENAISRLM